MLNDYTSNNLLAKFEKEIKGISPISIDDENYHLKQWQQFKNIKSRDILITSHLPISIKIANQLYKSASTIHFEDYLSESYLGLFEAVDNFEQERANGKRLYSYCAYICYNYIVRFINTHGRTIRIPMNRQLELKKGEFVITTNTVSLDSPINGDEGFMLHDVVSGGTLEKDFDFTTPANDSDMFWCTVKEEIEKRMPNRSVGLSSEDKYDLIHHQMLDFGDRIKNYELGEYFGCSKQRISQITTNIIDELRCSRKIRNIHKQKMK